MSVNLGKNDFITIAGSVLVAVGAYAPMISLGRLGDVSYADASKPEVYGLIFLAILASVLIFANKRKLSMFAAIGAWLVLLWPVLSNMGGGSDDGGMLSKITDAAADPLQKVAEQLFSNILDFQWGGFAFLGGMILVLVGSVMNFRAGD